jgi:hypothetical protein
LALNLSHLNGVHFLRSGIVRHCEEDHVAGRIGPVHLEEITLTPEGMPCRNVGQQFGYLMDEEIVHIGRMTHLQLRGFVDDYVRSRPRP